MDKWMVAIAAGAGHIAQHFKKFQQAGDRVASESLVQGSISEKPDSSKQLSDKKWPFHMSKRRGLKNDDSCNEFDGEKEIISGSCEGSDGILENVERGDLLHELLTPRSRMGFRSRRRIRRAVRPLSSLERCLMAHVEMEEYTSSPLASPSIQTVRSFLVTDGTNVINRAGSVEKKLQSYAEEKNRSVDATLLVCLGISFGMLYSFMENKREVEKLNRLLKQKENLVQDLEEEIEMKDSLVMQELTIDDHKSKRTDGSFDYRSPHSVSHDHNNKDSVFMEAKDDAFNRIETELEAELEMLELNMTSSTLERKISNLVELDPDFEPGVAQGELRADMLDDITTPSPNYAVSPRELSLRLHEVLQSQLEERIRELEAEIETRNQKSWKDFSSSDAGDENRVDEPVVLNLSGEALDAYNESCNEFAKFDELDDDGTPHNGGGTGGDELDFDGTPHNGGGTGGDELDFDEDEMYKLLIKHIVEKARQGSPAVLNAQRALFSE
ncbi:hypothetical protein L1987_47314 [Smallanthus sonchifolius]|uniref:Uncharacterized protein n=1 Tax=Smallanthus sonchifolius TaxID=185202 RepID=A0ACB9G279_9ASTR|nr:hypothetical protein L1987_47314 [Smallanthus sonchifolius]